MGFFKGFVKGVGQIFKNPVQALTIAAVFFIPGIGAPTAMYLAAVATTAAAYGNYQTARMAEKAKAAYNNSLQDRLTNALTAEEPFQVIYGTAKVGGAIVAVLKSGSKDEYRHIVMVHAAHEVEEIGDVFINGTNIGALDANGDVQTGSKYYKNGTSFVRVKKHLGTASDPADASLISECPSFWTSSHLLRGFAYTVIRVKLTFTEFQSGLPQINVVVKGKKLYDPRTSTTAWSDNPALCIYDYLTSEYGANQPTSSLVLSTFNTAADACDQTIIVGKRYTCNGSFKTDQDPKQILDTLADSMAGFISQSGGWMIHAGVYTAPVLSLTEADTVGGLQIAPAPSLNDVFNTVKGQFSNPDKDYIVTDYQPYQNASYLAVDDKELPIDYVLLFTNSNQRCQNIARVITERARNSLTVKGKFTLKAWPLQCGDRVSLTNSAFGWDEKVFRVVEWNFNIDSPVELVLQEDSTEIYDESDDVITDTYGNPDLPDIFAVNPPTSLAATVQNTVATDGTIISSLYVTWTAPLTIFLNRYEIQWYQGSTPASDDILYSSGTSINESFTITPIIAGQSYYVRVRSVNNENTASDWATYTTSTTGDTTAPNAPTSVLATPAKQSIIITWTNPTAADFSTTEVWFNTSATLTGITRLADVRGNIVIHDNLGSNTTRYYYLRSKDTTGNISAWTSVVSATSQTNLSDEIANSIVSTAKFAQGIRPVEIVDTLPSTGNTEGRVVYLTTDNKLYRYDGSAWTKSTDGADLVANSITAGKIAVGAIGADQIAANAIVADKMAANSITALNGAIADLTVGTIKIADNAVTFAPTFFTNTLVQSDSWGNANDIWYTVRDSSGVPAEVTLTAAANQKVIVYISADLNQFGPDRDLMRFRITRGTASGAMTVDGAYSSGATTINVSGATGLFKTGQTISINDVTYTLTADTTNTSMVFTPGLATSITTGTRIIYNGVPLEFEPNFKADGEYRIFSYTFQDLTPNIGTNVYQFQYIKEIGITEASSINIVAVQYKK